METYSIKTIKEACARAFAKKAYWSSQPVRTVGPAGPARRRPTTPGFGFSVPVTQKAAPSASAKTTTAPKSLEAAPKTAPKPTSGLSALTRAPAYPTGDADYQRFLSKAKGLGWKYNPNSRVWTTQNGQTHTDDYIRGQLQSRLGTPKLQPPVSQAQTTAPSATRNAPPESASAPVVQTAPKALQPTPQPQQKPDDWQTAPVTKDNWQHIRDKSLEVLSSVTPEERKQLDAMKPITYFNDNPMNLANTAVGRGITGALDGIGSGFSAAGRGIAGLASGGVNAIRSLF